MDISMKSLLYLIGGLGLAAAYFVSRNQQQAAAAAAAAPVDVLAHRLQDAWADHHTVV